MHVFVVDAALEPAAAALAPAVRYAEDSATRVARVLPRGANLAQDEVLPVRRGIRTDMEERQFGEEPAPQLDRLLHQTLSTRHPARSYALKQQRREPADDLENNAVDALALQRAQRSALHQEIARGDLHVALDGVRLHGDALHAIQFVSVFIRFDAYSPCRLPWSPSAGEPSPRAAASPPGSLTSSAADS